MSADCKKRHDLEYLVSHSSAVMDAVCRTAVFSFPFPSNGWQETTVFVFSSGKIACMGADSVHRAVACTKKVLDILKCDRAVPMISGVMMSGTMPIVGIGKTLNRLAIHGRMYRVSRSYDIADGAILVLSNTTDVQLFVGKTETKVLASGPTEDMTSSTIAHIYDICRAR